VKKRHVILLILLTWCAAGCSGNYSSGDRVLVAKFLYDTGLSEPHRYDVVVFKYPEKPLKDQVPTNYIKRLLGLPGEILAIFFGRLYSYHPETPPFNDRNVRPEDLWQLPYMHVNDERCREWFEKEGKFSILRKPPDVMLALKRIVYDNDHPARDLQRPPPDVNVLPPRWDKDRGQGGSWTTDTAHGFHNTGQGGRNEWLRYQHITRPASWPKVGEQDQKPKLITDFSGYNSYELGHREVAKPRNWVGDLLLECQLTVDRAEGEFTLELSKGVDRFQARWDLKSGACTLVRIGRDGKEDPLDSKSTRVNKAGVYQLRFANVDERLTVWVDRELPFGDGKTYAAPRQRGPTRNDLDLPASIGSKGAAVQVHHLKLWRDTYYTLNASETPDIGLGREIDWSEPDTWRPLRELDFKTMYVQPGHYLCLGDNSPESSDSRAWGVVPQRLLLGRALLVYFPFDRAGRIK
jgi:signal peptidase I